MGDSFCSLPFGYSVNIIFHIYLVNFVSEAVSVTLIAHKNSSVSLESQYISAGGNISWRGRVYGVADQLACCSMLGA